MSSFCENYYTLSESNLLESLSYRVQYSKKKFFKILRTGQVRIIIHRGQAVTKNFIVNCTETEKTGQNGVTAFVRYAQKPDLICNSIVFISVQISSQNCYPDMPGKLHGIYCEQLSSSLQKLVHNQLELTQSQQWLDVLSQAQGIR